MKIIGKGNTAEILDYGDGKVCKLFYEKFSKNVIDIEYNNAVCVEKCNLPVPKVYGMINIGDRTGVIYSRLYGKSMLDNISKNEEINSWLNIFCDTHKQIINCHIEKILSYKKFLCNCVRSEKDEKLKSEIYSMIDKLPDGDCLCHGDFHPGNVLIDNKDNVFVIDFMNVCCGVWQYDVARTYFLLSQGSLPDEVSSESEFVGIRKMIADMYLKKMNVKFDEIEKYVSIIKICRIYEMQ